MSTRFLLAALAIAAAVALFVIWRRRPRSGVILADTIDGGFAESALAERQAVLWVRAAPPALGDMFPGCRQVPVTSADAPRGWRLFRVPGPTRATVCDVDMDVDAEGAWVLAPPGAALTCPQPVAGTAARGLTAW